MKKPIGKKIEDAEAEAVIEVPEVDERYVTLLTESNRQIEHYKGLAERMKNILIFFAILAIFFGLFYWQSNHPSAPDDGDCGGSGALPC